MENEPKHFYAFGPFGLDTEERVLRRDSQPIALTPKAVETLLILLQNAGRLVDKDELMKKVWPDAFVEEGNLAKNIFTLRKVLGEYRPGEEYIQTVPKRGYRFSAPVSERTPVIAGAGLVGKRISRYRVLEILGGGGMGIVYKAEDIKLGRHVALKFLPEELAGNPVAIKRLEREARAASALDQPHICAVHDFDQYEGQTFIAMQYLEGQTIRERIDATRSGELPFRQEELVEIAIQITGALASAHAKGIIHRDIKPANIFLTKSGDAKILDFGVAALQDLESLPEQDLPNGLATARVQPSPSTQRATTQSTISDVKLTRTGTAMGTASYMSPEQIRGEKLDCRTDLFSFGLVLYEMATGQRAFQGDTTVVMHDAILHHSFASPRSLNGAIPVKLERIIDRALQKDRDQRYQTAAQLRHDLARLREPGSQRWRLPRFGLAAAAVTILLAAAAAIYDSRSARSAPRITDPRERRLISNSIDNPVDGNSAISLDGRYLAYVDRLGIHVQTIDTGETTNIPPPEGFDTENVLWSIANWFPSNKEFAANAQPRAGLQNNGPAQRTSFWVLGLTSAPRKIKEDAKALSVSPDGAWIAFSTRPGRSGQISYDAEISGNGHREIWLIGPHGEGLRKLVETPEERFVGGFDWARDGRHFLYVDGDKDSFTVFSADSDSSARTPLSSWTNDGLLQVTWLRDGRVLYVNKESLDSDKTCSLWQQRVDPGTGRAQERPARIINWDEFCPYGLTASADAKRVAFIRTQNESTIGIGDLTAIGRKSFATVPFTLSEGWNNFLDWTADSESILFSSDRNDKWQIFLQSVGSEDARPLLAGQAARGLSLTALWGTGAKLSPDDRWLLYFVNNAHDPSAKTQVLMRLPVGGGVAEPIANAGRAATLVCSKVKGGGCVIEERTPDQKEVVFTALNPLSGRGREIARIAAGSLPNEQLCGLDDVCYPWALSPDGEAIAVHGHRSNHFELISAKTGQRSSFNSHGWLLMDWISWNPGKDALFASALHGQDFFVLRFGLNGESRVVLRETGDRGLLPSLSPDARLLALTQWRASNNVWMIDNF
jgi:serine/threonine protein kinase/DNA-binding winged helix-turn-helix (wHTH) protein